MSHRARRITDAVQTYDRLLYAKDDGRAIRIFRKGKAYRPEQLSYDVKVWNLISDDHLVMSMTDTWGVNGKRVDWGIEPIMARLRALDLWNSDNLANRFFEQEEIDQKSRERQMRNSTEAFLYDFKSQFARATNDVNTSNLSKRVKFK